MPKKKKSSPKKTPQKKTSPSLSQEITKIFQDQKDKDIRISKEERLKNEESDQEALLEKFGKIMQEKGEKGQEGYKRFYDHALCAALDAGFTIFLAKFKERYDATIYKDGWKIPFYDLNDKSEEFLQAVCEIFPEALCVNKKICKAKKNKTTNEIVEVGAECEDFLDIAGKDNLVKLLSFCHKYYKDSGRSEEFFDKIKNVKLSDDCLAEMSLIEGFTQSMAGCLSAKSASLLDFTEIAKSNTKFLEDLFFGSATLKEYSDSRELIICDFVVFMKSYYSLSNKEDFKSKVINEIGRDKMSIGARYFFPGEKLFLKQEVAKGTVDLICVGAIDSIILQYQISKIHQKPFELIDFFINHHGVEINFHLGRDVDLRGLVLTRYFSGFDLVSGVERDVFVDRTKECFEYLLEVKNFEPTQDLVRLMLKHKEKAIPLLLVFIDKFGKEKLLKLGGERMKELQSQINTKATGGKKDFLDFLDSMLVDKELSEDDSRAKTVIQLEEDKKVVAFAEDIFKGLDNLPKKQKEAAKGILTGKNFYDKVQVIHGTLLHYCYLAQATKDSAANQEKFNNARPNLLHFLVQKFNGKENPLIEIVKHEFSAKEEKDLLYFVFQILEFSVTYFSNVLLESDDKGKVYYEFIEDFLTKFKRHESSKVYKRLITKLNKSKESDLYKNMQKEQEESERKREEADKNKKMQQELRIKQQQEENERRLNARKEKKEREERVNPVNKAMKDGLRHGAATLEEKALVRKVVQEQRAAQKTFKPGNVVNPQEEKLKALKDKIYDLKVELVTLKKALRESEEDLSRNNLEKEGLVKEVEGLRKYSQSLTAKSQELLAKIKELEKTQVTPPARESNQIQRLQPRSIIHDSQASQVIDIVLWQNRTLTQQVIALKLALKQLNEISQYFLKNQQVAKDIEIGGLIAKFAASLKEIENLETQFQDRKKEIDPYRAPIFESLLGLIKAGNFEGFEIVMGNFDQDMTQELLQGFIQRVEGGEIIYLLRSSLQAQNNDFFKYLIEKFKEGEIDVNFFNDVTSDGGELIKAGSLASIAFANKNYEALQILVENNYDLDVENSDGQNVIDEIFAVSDTEALRCIFYKGNKPSQESLRKAFDSNNLNGDFFSELGGLDDSFALRREVEKPLGDFFVEKGEGEVGEGEICVPPHRLSKDGANNDGKERLGEIESEPQEPTAKEASVESSAKATNSSTTTGVEIVNLATKKAQGEDPLNRSDPWGNKDASKSPKPTSKTISALEEPASASTYSSRQNL